MTDGGTGVGTTGCVPERTCAIANPPAPLGAVMTTLVIGVVLEAAARSAPALPLAVRETVPSVVDPFMNVAVISNAPKLLGSISKPNLNAGVDKLRVSELTLIALKTRGVELSVFGGEPQLPHPPPGTVAAVTVGEKVTVCPPPEIDDTVAKFASEKVMTVVEPVYAASGVDIGLNWAKAGTTRIARLASRVITRCCKRVPPLVTE